MQLGPISNENICFCSRIELRSETVDLYDRSAMAYNMALFALSGIALIGLYSIRLLPLIWIAYIGGTLIAAAPCYYLNAFIFWSRPYERLKKRTDLPVVSPTDASFFVVGDPHAWQLPEDVSATPFETREFPGLASYLLSPNVTMDHIIFLFPLIAIINGWHSGNAITIAIGLAVLAFVLLRFPWSIWYDVAPGRIKFMRVSSFGLKARLEVRYLLADRKIIADLAKRRLILLGTDQADVISLRFLKDAEEFCYYAMLARAATPLAQNPNDEVEHRPTDAGSLGSRVWGYKKRGK